VTKCWATPTTEADDKVRHTMLNDGCPTQDQTVSLLESKDSNKARWEAQMFRFVDEKEVWLHCDIKACDSRKYNCETVCPNDARKRRDVFTDIVKSRSARGVSEAPASGSGAYQPNILTVGPMRSAEYYDEVSQGKEEYKSDFLDSFLKPSDSSVHSTNDDSISDFFSNLMSMFDFDFFRSSEQ